MCGDGWVADLRRYSMGIFWRKRTAELDEEVRGHLEMAVRERVERGETEDAARRAVLREFGGVELVKETTRDAWGWQWAEDFIADLQYGLRMMRKNWGFTCVAILTLTLGIGANTALFSVVNGVLLNPLPYPDSERLVWLAESKPNFATGSISFPNFQDWQKENRTFVAMGASRGFAFSLTGMGDAEQLPGVLLTSGYFSVLGVQPALGREFAPGEDAIGAAPIVVISDGLWKRKFG